jgi:hypothetical protein
MALSDIVNVSIALETSRVSLPGFGTPMIVGYHTRFADRARRYTSLAAMTSDGFLVTDPEYLAARALVSQQPYTVTEWKVGRRANPPTQRIELTPTAANNAVYSFKIGTQTVTFTSDGSATVTEIIAGLKTAIDALALGLTTSDQTTHLRIVANTPGVLFDFYEFTSNLAVKDATPDNGLAADLDAIEAADSDWYGLILTSKGDAEALAAAAWAESRLKIFKFSTPSTDVGTSASNDVMSAAQAASYFRTSIDFYPRALAFEDAAYLGHVLPRTPGSEKVMFHSLSGVTVYPPTDTQIGYIEGKNGGYYTTYAGVAMTANGKVAAGEWLDNIRGRDWIQVNMQAAVYGLFTGPFKVSFDDEGITVFGGTVESVLRQAVTNGILARSPAPKVTVPKSSDLTSQQKSSRRLSGVSFTGTLAGAIHAGEINGSLAA